MRLLDSEKVYQYIKETPLIPNHAKGAVFLDLEAQATYLQDAVARDCFDRILKENDVMREQLASIGKKIGEDMSDVRPVVRGAWENTGSDVWKCSACGYGIMPWNAGVNFCPNCGAVMEKS